MTLLDNLRARLPKFFPAVAVVAILVGTGGGYALHEVLKADCCAPGASCCYPGSPCCSHRAAAQ